MAAAQAPCVIEDEECAICASTCPLQEKTPCCKQLMHFNCVMEWYKSQQEKHLWPTCPFCRPDPPASLLHQLDEFAPSSPPSRWEAARRHTEFIRHPWDENIPLGRESFFLEFLNLYLPTNVFVYQTIRGLHLTKIRRYENRRISRFLAQTKREAIRRFRFELANLLDF